MSLCHQLSTRAARPVLACHRGQRLARRHPPGSLTGVRRGGCRCCAWTCRFRGLDWLAGDAARSRTRAKRGPSATITMRAAAEWLALGQFDGDQGRTDQGSAQRGSQVGDAAGQAGDLALILVREAGLDHVDREAVSISPIPRPNSSSPGIHRQMPAWARTRTSSKIMPTAVQAERGAPADRAGHQPADQRPGGGAQPARAADHAEVLGPRLDVGEGARRRGCRWAGPSGRAHALQQRAPVINSGSPIDSAASSPHP